MCTVSMVHDYWNDRWKTPIFPSWPATDTNITMLPTVTKQDLDNLREEFRKEMEIMRGLLREAREYDRRNNEPDCPSEDKLALLKKMADLLGVDVSFVEKDAEDEARENTKSTKRKRTQT